MKNLLKIIIFILIIIILIICFKCCGSRDTKTVMSDRKQDAEITFPHSNEGLKQIILQFPESLPAEESAYIDSLSRTFKVKKNQCPCGSGIETIQQWTFPSNTDIEPLIKNLKRRAASVKGDIPFDIQLPPYNNLETNKKTKIIYEKLIDSPNPQNKVIIAVVDTGLDVSRFTSESNILYNTSFNASEKFCETEGSSDAPEISSGYNFIDNNYNIFDGIGHGTLVTKEILNAFGNNKNINILPLKVFGEDGKGSYWDIVCAFGYLKKIQENNDRRIHIINASFGGTLSDDEYVLTDSITNDTFSAQSILKDLIDDLKEKSVIVASAGNSGINNNTINHFISDFKYDFKLKNMMPVGGHIMVEGSIKRDEDSNYSNKSVDISTLYSMEIEGYYLENDDVAFVSGTSFSSARLSGIFANYLKEKSILTVFPESQIDDFYNSPIIKTSINLKDDFIGGKYIK